MTHPLLGVGLYTLPEAARLLQISPTKLRRWAEGYPFVSSGQRRTAEPIIRRDLQALDGEPVLTFNDLLELYMIKLFRDAGVSLQTIRAAAEQAARMYRTNHPFAIKRFETDGKRIFATLQEQGVEGVAKPTLLQDLNLSQMVMDSIARPFFRRIEYREFEPLRYWPNGKDGHIVLDPQRAFGKPIDARSGVPTAVLYEMARGGEPVENIARWYDMDVEAVEEAVAYEVTLKAA
ncbi:MAG TPA: DUF433 domain-containing protein [Chthonomonadaceae bacterium]|jgi:uncharacterized protein (DUF433 family)/DNA-binding transcriptional MerR regulator|nr:DUF433 domain-containing protein [Chthonomonadaceae bacterium]